MAPVKQNTWRTVSVKWDRRGTHAQFFIKPTRVATTISMRLRLRPTSLLHSFNHFCSNCVQQHYHIIMTNTTANETNSSLNMAYRRGNGSQWLALKKQWLTPITKRASCKKVLPQAHCTHLEFPLLNISKIFSCKTYTKAPFYKHINLAETFFSLCLTPNPMALHSQGKFRWQATGTVTTAIMLSPARTMGLQYNTCVKSPILGLLLHSYLHDTTNSMIKSPKWNTAAGVAGNTAQVCTRLCTGVENGCTITLCTGVGNGYTITLCTGVENGCTIMLCTGVGNGCTIMLCTGVGNGCTITLCTGVGNGCTITLCTGVGNGCTITLHTGVQKRLHHHAMYRCTETAAPPRYIQVLGKVAPHYIQVLGNGCTTMLYAGVGKWLHHLIQHCVNLRGLSKECSQWWQWTQLNQKFTSQDWPHLKITTD